MIYVQNYQENVSSMVIFAAIEHFLFRGSDFLQKKIEVKNSYFWHFDRLLGRASGFFKKLTSHLKAHTILSNKPSSIENDQEIRKFSLYRLIRSILAKLTTFKGAWLHPQKGKSLKCIFLESAFKTLSPYMVCFWIRETFSKCGLSLKVFES